MREYPIYDGNESIGIVKVMEEGMLYRLECQCVPRSGKTEKIAVKWLGGGILLGSCIPGTNGMTLVKRIAKRKLPNLELCFCVVRNLNKRIQLEHGRPCGCISVLSCVKLEVEDGVYYLTIDQSSSRPTGQ